LKKILVGFEARVQWSKCDWALFYPTSPSGIVFFFVFFFVFLFSSFTCTTS
jgi:hypothetical protein